MSVDTSHAASDPRRSAWVAANAGAGKTHTLANRVTRLLLAGAKPEKILCLTYTKAAAAEMQGRLFDQLGRWSMLPDAELAANIETIGAAADDLRRARRLFAQALETPGGLKIQTLHAFCQYVLSRFPLEASVAPSFRVLDEQTTRELIADARARVLERAGSGDAPRAASIAYLVTQTSEGRLQQILDAALGNDRRKLDRFFQTLGSGENALGAALRLAHGAGAHDTVESIAAEFFAGLDRSRLREIAEWLSAGGKIDAERGERLLGAVQADSAFAAFELLREALLKANGERYAALASKASAKARPDLLGELEELERNLVATEERRRAAHAAQLSEAALSIADTVRDIYAAEKRARGVLDYDDLIVETLRLLEKRDAAAWVLYKLDGGLDHILIDEAQDTSPEQWQIVRKLTEEFFAGEGVREGDVRTVFAVGDEKQSIFSFQGADAAQFDINRRYFMQRAHEAGHDLADTRLETSRRSAPEVLSFVDTVFEGEAAREGLSSIEIVHLPLRTQAKGRVEFWPALKPSNAPEPDPWRPVDVESEASPVVRLAVRIAEQIKQWTDGKTRLPGHDDPIRPGDIMILLPRREPFGGEIIRRLKERGVPVAGADRIALSEQIAVMDLIALGRFALLAQDDLNLAALLRSPLVGLSEEELFSLSHERKGSLWHELSRRRDELASFIAASEFLSDILARADYAPPFEFFAHALETRGLRLKLLARLGTEASDAIDEFLSLALSYETANTPSLEGFLHWVERGGAEIKRDMERGRDEVRVMTVHGAKGLEADIVILPDTTSLPEQPGAKGHLLYTEDGVLFPLADSEAPARVKAAKAAAHAEILKEHRRLLYVALTRAKDRLYICGFENKKGVKPGSWYTLAEQAAAKIGVEIVRGGETMRVLGEAGEESGAVAKKEEVSRVLLPAWARRAAPLEAPSPHLVRPSDATEFEEPASGSSRSSARFRRGLLVHAMLARLPDIAPEARREIALKFLKARGVAEDADALVEETLRVLNDRVFAPTFAAGSRSEAGIVADLPELGKGARVSGRIDRLAVTDSEVLIVDFKTNRPPPTREADVPRYYATQMALYRAAAAKIFPGRRIACALAWTEGPSLMPLSDTLLEGEIRRIRARLDTSP